MNANIKMAKALVYTAASCLLFVACRNKTASYLCRKWDCVKLENMDAITKSIRSPEDSAGIVNFEKLATDLSWTFNSDKTYQCMTGSRITSKGSFALLDNGKTIACTSDSKNSNNIYSIVQLSDEDLVISNTVNGIPLVMHFRPH
jgi:hypothetical protein